MNKLQQVWHTITEIGVDEQALGREVVKVRLLNQLIFIAFSVSLINVPFYLITGNANGLLLSNIGNVLLEGFTIYFTYKRHYKLARVLAVFVFPTLMAFHVVCHGLNLGSVFTTIGVMAFMLYEGHKRVQIAAIAYSCILFISSKLYVIETFDDTFQKHNYNELLFFPMVLMALGLMLMLYQKELKKYEVRQSELIDDLEDKNKALSSINEELERFTYIASHDLKTPLRTISTYLDLTKLHLKRDNKEAAIKGLSSAKMGTKQMYALISDILEYKEINNNKENREVLDLNDILVESLANVDVKLKKDKVTILSGVLPTIKGRKNEFQVLFQHLIENGLKYNTSTEPTLEIGQTINDQTITIFFKDNGIGIAPEYHEKVFQFFKRLHRNEEYEGTGIGLGLCQKIIHTYKGEITLESAVNKGATFMVNLPLDVLVKE